MFRKSILLALTLCFVASVADAAPWWRRSRSSGSCTSGTCTTTAMPQVTNMPASSMPVYSGNTGSAQGVAEMMATRGSVQHFGNPTGTYEGVASGFSSEQALGSCCFSTSGMPVVDQGVARGRNGRWYACKRYRR
jgi:hypothetical protein